MLHSDDASIIDQDFFAISSVLQSVGFNSVNTMEKIMVPL